jgi:long-chain acyl-CoA synthetase
VSTTHDGTFATMSKLALAMKGKPGPYALAPAEASPNLLGMAIFHSGGQQSLLFAFHVGRPVVLLERFRAETAVEMIRRHRIDNLVLLPTMLYDLAHYDVPADLSSVRTALVTGGAAAPELRKLFEERYHVPILANYGATEIGHIAGWTARDVAAGRWVPGSAGRIYDGVELEIRDDAGRVLPEGDVGEIVVRTSLTRGYVDGAGELVDREGWVRSGDMGRIDAGRILYVVGRKREMIKSGGFQVWPSEIEEVLRRHPMVADVAVVGLPDARLGEVPKAFVVLAGGKGAGGPLRDELIRFVRERLAHFKAIRDVAFVAALPRTEAGKINRRALVE